MSKFCSDIGIGEADRRIFRLYKLLVSVGRSALLFVFKVGCKKEPSQTLQEYLEDEKNMSHRDFKNRFDTGMKKQMDKDPSGMSYDISLLWACLKWGCDLSTKQEDWEVGKENLESLCTKVKNMRNELCHMKEINDDNEMNEYCKNIKEVVEKIFISAGNKYGIPDDEIKIKLKEKNSEICKIMKAPLGEYDINAIKKFRDEQKKAINEIGKVGLSERYKDISKIDPASFVTGKEQLHVENVFTKLEVIFENMDEYYEVDYTDLFEVKYEHGKRPNVIIVEGDAGAGKTTLTKLILSDWAEGSKTFTGLAEYDLVFHAEGKKCISSYLEVIQGLLPTASYKFDDDDLVRSVQQLKILLVMDGFDELNKQSEKLMKELSEIQITKSCGCLHLLVTTRPSKLTDLCSILKGHSRILTKLKGISMEKRVEFVTKLHNEMIRETLSSQNTQELVDLLKKSQARLGEHYRLPLNLTLLTYLWASDPDKVNLETTATGLYVAFQELIDSRLRDRLKGQMGVVALPDDKSRKVVQEFQEKLYSVCLDMLLLDSMQLSSKLEMELREKCDQLDVPFNEMIEAFFVIEKEWTSSGYKTELTVPHKSILEFYAAQQFMEYITTRNNESNQKLIEELKKFGKQEDEIFEIINKKPEDAKSLKKICRDLLKTDKNLAKYENMFLHLTGLLADQYPDTLSTYSEELVQILKDAAFKGTKWLNLLVEAKCDKTLASLLAPLFDLQLIIRDGHMGAALTLFSHVDTTTPIQVILENEVNYIPLLHEMLSELSVRNCAVEIFFQHQWKNDKYGISDEWLGTLLPTEHSNVRCRVTKFTGLLNTVSHMPESMKILKLAFTDTEHAKQLLTELKNLVEHHEISYIGIHVMPRVMAEGLLPLPVLKHGKREECGDLWLSQVDKEWKAKCDVIRALLPEEGTFHSLRFPKSNFTATQCQKIIYYMKELKIKVEKTGGIRFSSATISKEQLGTLKTLAKDCLGCALYCCDESSMW